MNKTPLNQKLYVLQNSWPSLEMVKVRRLVYYIATNRIGRTALSHIYRILCVTLATLQALKLPRHKPKCFLFYHLSLSPNNSSSCRQIVQNSGYSSWSFPIRIDLLGWPTASSQKTAQSEPQHNRDVINYRLIKHFSAHWSVKRAYGCLAWCCRPFVQDGRLVDHRKSLCNPVV